MPAEPTKARLKRRSSRKDLEDYRFDPNHARELEQKRSRGEVSCAECRRLKIKCDKRIPCQSCQRRGCAALCPNGSLATGQGTRFVLAATEHLHTRITGLSGRIRQLEDALASLQAQHSSDPHPLLREDLIMNEENDDEQFGIREDLTTPSGAAEACGPSQGDVIDAFGTLSISDHGISRFFGPTGGSESLLLANLDIPSVSPHTPDTPGTSKSPPRNTNLGDLALFSRAFPFTPIGQTADIQELIESHLPPWERTVELCETYLEQIAWLFQTLKRNQLMDEMLPAIYNKHSSAPSPPRNSPDREVIGTEEDYTGPHDMALLFIVLAIGSLVQPESPGALGEHFHQLSRAAISLQPILEKPSSVTIQTLHLMSIYNAMSGSDSKSETSMEVTWSLTTLAAHLSQTIGMHRDSARWGLSPKAVKRRRQIFWDLFIADVWQSLNTGRPPSISLAYIDCSYPQHEDVDSAFQVWQCRFAAECVAEVTSRTLTAEAPSYATIMELDKKVREFPLPEVNGQEKFSSSFERFVLTHIRETVLMYIHRSFFAQAIIDNPENPLKSPYAPSFLASYRASSTILKAVREQFNIFPISCSKFWMMWTFAFSAAVVFGTVVTRGPRSPLAQSAMAELEQACILFSKASVYNIRATKALPILTKLSEKARYTLATVSKDPEPSSGDNGILWNIKQEDTDDELSILAGHTRFVFQKKPQDHSPSPPKYSLYPPASQNSAQHHQYTSQSHASSSHRQSQVMDYSLGPPQAPMPPHVRGAQMINSWPGPLEQRDSNGFISIPPMEDHIRYPFTSSSRPIHVDGRDTTSSWGQQPTYPGPMTSSAPAPSHNSSSSTQRGYPPTHNRDHHSQQRYPSVNPYPTGSSSFQQPSSTQHHQTPPILRRRSSQPQTQFQDPYPQRYHGQQDYQPQSSMQQPQVPHQQHQYALSGLADLGLAARDSRLDERWGTFMEDSGLLDGIDFRR